MTTGLRCVPVWIRTRWQSTEASRSPCGPPVRRAALRAGKSPRASSMPASEEPSSCTRAWLRAKHPSSSNALAVGPVNNNQCSFQPLGPGPYPWLTPGKSRMIAGARIVRRLPSTVKCPDPSLTSTMAWLLRVRPARRATSHFAHRHRGMPGQDPSGETPDACRLTNRPWANAALVKAARQTARQATQKSKSSGI